MGKPGSSCSAASITSSEICNKMGAAVLFLILGLAACTEARSTGPCTETSQLFTKCADLIKEPRVMCAGYLSSPYAESEYMDCMRDTMDYSNICDRCVCTMTGRSDWHMCAVS